MVSSPWKVVGPFEIDKHRALSWKEIFRDATAKHEKLQHAIGVYVIASKIQSKLRIHYIGMTFSQGFEKEVFSARNCGLIWDELLTAKTGKLKLWLIAKPTVSGKSYSADSRLKQQAYVLETLLIMHAKAAGHKLINTSKMQSAEGLAVKGLFGSFKSGKPAAGLQELAASLKM